MFDALLAGEAPSTKQAMAALGDLAAAGRCLVVLDRSEDAAWRSVRNVPTLHVLAADQLNTYDVVVSDQVVFTKAALESFLAGRAARAASASAAAQAQTEEVAE